MMKPRPLQWLLAILVLALPAAAGASDGYAVYAIEPSKPWLAILCAVVSLAGVGVVAFKKAKRTHLD